jgi:hypothetical protein
MGLSFYKKRKPARVHLQAAAWLVLFMAKVVALGYIAKCQSKLPLFDIANFLKNTCIFALPKRFGRIE